jgi:TRAP-type mannitol/chloroaromatic compound transport system substrate-binding protein
MERRKVLKHGGLAGILAAASGPAIAQTLPEVRWRLTSSFPKSLDTLWGAGENIVKRSSGP